ncbi:LOW QUALITY PROTEIN: Reverse transcriptase, partial [Phytophthora palmivora]
MAAPTPAAPATPDARPPPPMHTDTSDIDDDPADIDDGEVYAAMHIGPDAVPQRRPRLRLRQLPDEEEDVVGAMVERLGASLAAKIADASDWETAEGYITALPHLLYDKLRPYSQDQRRPEPRHQHEHGERDGDDHRRGQQDTVRRRRRRQRGRSGVAKRQRQRRPPRVTRHHREHRLDEALDDLHAVERASPSDRTAVRRARRRVGRVNSAITQQRLRSRFDKDEKACVDEILATARMQRESARTTDSCTDTAPRPAPPVAVVVDDSTCPIPGVELWRFFDGVNTPQQEFAPDAATGATFRSAMAHLPTASRFRELLTEAPTLDDIETQLQHVRGASSPGLDGVGYDVYQSAIATGAGCSVPEVLGGQEGATELEARSRATSPQEGRARGPGELAAHLSPTVNLQTLQRRPRTKAGAMDGCHDRHAPGQKGFRALNGCGEHNFLAATLVDQARRKRRTLFEVWYDFRNAFGSVPFALLWDSLARLGVPDDYVAMCKGLYESAAFVVGNAVDGTTDPVSLRVGVFQGCPLSPQLFNAAISPLLFALQRLPDTGVQLSADDCL